MIHAKDLVKTFGETVAVDHASFHVREGQIVGFLGPNGAGKTTALRIITCFMPANDGTATVAGHDVHDEPLAVRRVIGYLPENVPLYGEMRVRQYLDYRGRLKGLRERRDRRKRIDEVMDRCWVTDVERKQCGALSKGYRQRVGLADALIHDPKILILDEPTVGLDPNQIRETRKLIKALGSDHTVLLSTHILPEVEGVCDHIIIIHRGKIAATGTPEDLKEKHAGQAAIVLEADGPQDRIEQTLSAIDGVTSVTRRAEDGRTVFRIETRGQADLRGAVSRKIAEKGWTILELHRQRATLEDIFVRITMRED
ncbi:MAG TPA: ATP-binding cassette domain-containing protein [Planctomycetota bacterium]|nr:ATP-binding cassette domain-containing protein [Planctomycetota bacterium]